MNSGAGIAKTEKTPIQYVGHSPEVNKETTQDTTITTKTSITPQATAAPEIDIAEMQAALVKAKNFKKNKSFTESQQQNSPVMRPIQKPVIDSVKQSTSSKDYDNLPFDIDAQQSEKTLDLPQIEVNAEHWLGIVEGLNLKGVARQLLDNSEFISREENRLTIAIAPQQALMQNSQIETQINDALSAALSQSIKVNYQTKAVEHTLANQQAHKQAQQHQSALQAFYNDANVQFFVEHMQARVIEKSVDFLTPPHETKH